MPNIQQIIFPNTLESIDRFAFHSSNITKLVFPPSITKIDSAAVFGFCKYLNQISFSSPCQNYRIEDNCIISSIDNRLIRARADIETFALNVSIISTSSFSSTNLKKFIATKSLTKFESWAFNQAQNLISVDLTNSSLETMSSYSFPYCISLKSIVIPPTVKTIGAESFSNCTKLRNVLYLGSIDFTDVKVFPSPATVKVYVLSSYDYDKFCQASVIRISYIDMHNFVIFGKITCNYRSTNYNYLIFLVFILM